MKLIFLSILLSMFVIGCDESSYNPGDLVNESNAQGQTSNDDSAEEEDDDPVELTSLEELGLSLQQLMKALHAAYLNDLEELEIDVFADESDLDEDTQKLVEALKSENCEVNHHPAGVRIGSGEESGECPFSFTYATRGDSFYLHFSFNDEELLELNDIESLSMEGGSDEEGAGLYFQISSYNYGYASGEMSRERYREEGEYYYSDSVYLTLSEGDFGDEEFEDRIGELGKALFQLFIDIESELREQFQYDGDELEELL